MDSIARLLVYAVFVVFPLLLGASVYMAFTLRRRFPVIWAAWGNPDAWLYMLRTTPDKSFLGFLQERGYLKTGDPAYIRLGHIVRTGWFVVPILFVCAGITLAASLTQAGRLG